MEADMLQASFDQPKSKTTTTTLADRVRDAIAGLLTVPQELHPQVWAKTSGPHVLLGILDEEPFARLTPLGGGSYGLAFRAAGAQPESKSAWEPLFLVDELAAAVEHALVAADALAA
jgi:hypothetical protein